MKPCLAYDLPARAYHADPCPTPSLSSGIARTILAKSPAHAYAEHPRLGAKKKETTEAMTTGSLVHAILAGTVGDEIEVGDFTTFRSKAAQEWADAVRANGKIPALERDMDEARLIAAAVHEKASRGLTHDPFHAVRHEVSAFWQRNEVWHRARFDLLTSNEAEPRTIWDWKTIDDVSAQSVKRAMRRYRYDIQAAHYLAGLDALFPGFRGLHSFVFCFIEKTAPYSVRRYCLTSDALHCAAIDIGKAYDAFERALASGEWPDATTSMTTTIDLPTYDGDEESEIITPGESP